MFSFIKRYLLLKQIRKRIKNNLSKIKADKVVGYSGLAVLCAVSLLAFVPVPSDKLMTLLHSFLSGLGLNVLAGLLQQNYSDLLSQPPSDDVLYTLAESLTVDIEHNEQLRSEIGAYLETVDAFEIAENAVRGNPAIHGWLLVKIYDEINQYRSDFGQLHVTLADMKSFIKELDVKIHQLKQSISGSHEHFQLNMRYLDVSINPIWEVFTRIHEDYKESFKRYRNIALNTEIPYNSLIDIILRDSLYTQDLRLELKTLLDLLKSVNMNEKDQKAGKMLTRFVVSIIEYFDERNALFSSDENKVKGIESLPNRKRKRNKSEEFQPFNWPRAIWGAEFIRQMKEEQKFKRDSVVTRFDEIILTLQLRYNDVAEAYHTLRQKITFIE